MIDKPWAEPGLSHEDRAGELWDRLSHSWDYDNDSSAIVEALAAVRRDALEAAAGLAVQMGFDAIGDRIRRLGESAA